MLTNEDNQDMSLYSFQETVLHKRIISNLLLFNKKVTIEEIMERLKESKNPLILSYSYVRRLVNEIHEDRKNQLEHETKESVVAELSDMVDFVNNQLRAIANEEKIVYMDSKNQAEVRIFAQNNRIKALNSIVINMEKLTGLKMDLGLLERKLGEGSFDVTLRNAFVTLKEMIKNGESIPVTKSEAVGGLLLNNKDGGSVPQLS